MDPVVSAVNNVLASAIKRGASDIHFEPLEDGLRVRYRVDGVLCDQQPLPVVSMAQVIARIKVLAHIDLAQTRIPQDGKFQWEGIDLRVSTFPSVYGEKVVIRILDRSRTNIRLDQLGCSPLVLELLQDLVQRSQGFILVTGPTGSGKTTTLYAALSHVHAPEKNIITLEDPVEYHLDGITQGHIRPDSGFSFAQGIRALLRQDPDIAMIGEMRDPESARVAIEAALTGHLVLSTMHTNDAPGAIMRLMDMGIEPFLINAALTGVLAQRLVRTICIGCREAVAPTPEQETLLDERGIKLNQLYRGAGCTACDYLGYKGRIGIFELLVVTNDLRRIIAERPHFDELYAQALQDGMISLMGDGLHKVQAGLVSLDELLAAVS